MSDRRTFLRRLGIGAGSLPFLQFADPAFAQASRGRQFRSGDAVQAAVGADEDFWGWVRESYTVSPNLLNLNNGGVAPQPKVVQDAHIRYYQYCNEAPSYYMWQILDQGREPLREKLAGLCGCSAEEVAINRNSTEGLNTVIFGLNLKAGDEVVLTRQDYPNMINAWRQREKRDGVKLVWIDLPLPVDDETRIVDLYVKAFTARTRVVHVTHLINWTGQILPVRRIADEAHRRGIEVIADGAHTLAHMDFKVPDLGCDYFASSLSAAGCCTYARRRSGMSGRCFPTTSPTVRISASSNRSALVPSPPRWPSGRPWISMMSSVGVERRPGSVI
jgi:hypothetical protein